MSFTILEKLWTRTLNPDNDSVLHEDIWNKEMETLYKLGISMEETLRYLYHEKPDLKQFNSWINSRKKELVSEDKISISNVLSDEDLAFWNENGYVIVKNAISKEDCEATQKAIWSFLGMDPNNKESWYNRHEEQRGLMVNFSDHETLNKNRFSLRIKKAYEQLYKTTKLYKTIDKVSFNPPETNNFKFLGSPLHWDVSLKQPIPFALQGLLYLTDCGPNDGAFHCVAGFNNKIENWLNELDKDVNPREEAICALQPVPIVGKAGDFIIWKNTLPHCATANNGVSPRMVQYLTYLPEGYTTPAEWI